MGEHDHLDSNAPSSPTVPHEQGRRRPRMTSQPRAPMGPITRMPRMRMDPTGGDTPLPLPPLIFVLLVAAGIAVMASEVAAFAAPPPSSSYRPAGGGRLGCLGGRGGPHRGPGSSRPAAFLATHVRNRRRSPLHGLPPSKVVDDPEDVTPPPPPSTTTAEGEEQYPVIDPADIPELKYDATVHFPNQSWRRGEGGGCDDPIDAEWRREAEHLIEKAVRRVNGEFVGVTWFLAKCVITVGRNLDDIFTEDPALVAGGGPEVIVHEPIPGYDPRKDYDFEDDPKVLHDELRDKFGYPQMNELAEEPLLTPWEVDAVEAIGKSVIDALSLPEVEDRLEVLGRHEIAITCAPPTPADVAGFPNPGGRRAVNAGETYEVGRRLDLQRDYDACVGREVLVQTMDPFNSNRVLRGKLVSRDAMDVKISVDYGADRGGVREVTLPINFVDYVELDEEEDDAGADDSSFSDAEVVLEEELPAVDLEDEEFDM